MYIKSWFFTLLIAILLSGNLALAEEGANNSMETQQQNGTYNERGTRGFDPDNITCIDSSDGQRKKLSEITGWAVEGSCSWGSTSTPWFANPAVDTQKGTGLIPGGSGATIGQTATMTIKDGPHFTTRYFNAPSASSTTSGMTSNPVAGNLREQHNEFGFEVVVDKKTDPLEPYYLRFYIPYSVDSTQNTTGDPAQNITPGDMSGDATGNYLKEITEMDPNNPGVFNRYTITGTFTSTGDSYTYGSSCETGCTTDPEGPGADGWRERMSWP